MIPRIIDPTPSRRPLPVMYSIQDAAKLNTRERTTFYVSAFLFQVWLCELTLANSAQLAEQPDPTKARLSKCLRSERRLRFMDHE